MDKPQFSEANGPKSIDPARLFVLLAELVVEKWEGYSVESVDDHTSTTSKIRDRTGVQRSRSSELLLLTAMSFAVTIIGTRGYLELTGYPQLGNNELHLAHVLWGGLLLFIATLLPLTLVNRWVYTITAIFSGIGMGLFIDEVGKFISQSNDYFFKPAAPIIYLTFLASLWLYFRVRQPPSRGPRGEMYRALDGMGELLDDDLEERELTELQDQLMHISKYAENPNQSKLAHALLEVVSSGELTTVPSSSTFSPRAIKKLDHFEAEWFLRPVFRWLLGGALITLALFTISNFIQLVQVVSFPINFMAWQTALFTIFEISSVVETGWLSARVLLEMTLGSALLVSAALFISRREDWGVSIGIKTLVIYLVTLDVLIFYYAQFITIALVIFQLLLFWVLSRYHAFRLSK